MKIIIYLLISALLFTGCTSKNNTDKNSSTLGNSGVSDITTSTSMVIQENVATKTPETIGVVNSDVSSIESSAPISTTPETSNTDSENSQTNSLTTIPSSRVKSSKDYSKKELPLADPELLTPTYISYPQKNDKDKLYIIEKRTGKKIPQPKKVEEFYNDVYCMYACLKYETEEDFQQLFKDKYSLVNFDYLYELEDTISYNSRGEEKTAKVHCLFEPIENVPWWNFKKAEVKKASFSNVISFNYYCPVNYLTIETSEEITFYRLSTGEKVALSTVCGDGFTYYAAVKDGDNYKLYISHENKTFYKMHLEGELLPGTYGE